MADSVPAKLKGAQILPFVRRAQQLERFKPVMTYWLRYYTIQKIINAGLHNADAECVAYTSELMDKLEQFKAANPDEDAVLDETAASAYCEQFALTTFAKGDKDMAANSVTKGTADTLLAAATFLEMLAIWNRDLDPEVKSKQKFAKYHAARILKAFQNGEDPNLTNPVHETPDATSPSALDPDDPEVQTLNGTPGKPPVQNPYRSSVESAPDATAQPSPTISAPKVSPPPSLPPASAGYSAHRDVSPISQPANSRKGSVVSEGGGYFPRTDVPTFTADATAPSLPTASSVEDDPMGASPFNASPLARGPQGPQAPRPPSPREFYQNATFPAPLSQPPHQDLPPQPSFPPSPDRYADPPLQPPSQLPPPPFQPPHHPQFNNSSTSPQPRHVPPAQHYSQPMHAAPQTAQHGLFKTDEEAQMEATKHAKWAISALNFEDVNTAVKELRLALESLGAS